jgi:tetratricopeptide (TPR) repeat protein
VVQDARFDLLEALAAAREAGEADSCCTPGHSLSGLPGRSRTLEALARAEDKTQGIDARFLQIRAKAIRAHLALIQNNYGEALLLYEPVENFYRSEHYRFEEAQTMSRKAVALWLSGAPDEAIPEAFRSLGILKELGPNPELVHSSASFAGFFAVNDRIALARKAIQFAEEAPINLRNRDPAFLMMSAVIAAQIGDLPRASAMIDAALLSDPSPPFLNWLELRASIYIDQDRLDELDQHLEEWVGRGRERLGPLETTFISLCRANARLSTNRPQEAAEFLRAIPAAERPRWLSFSILVAESNIARLEGKPRPAIRLATQALREAAHDFASSEARDAQLQLARSYKAAGDLTQATTLLDKIRTDAEREGLKGVALEIRLITWEQSPPDPSRREQELKLLEADSTRAGYLAIARHAREAAAR